MPGDRSGGATTSHTIVVPALEALLPLLARPRTLTDYEQAVMEDNVLGKETIESRRRGPSATSASSTCCGVTPCSSGALGDLWNDDPAGHRLLAGLCALARDPVFRASAQAIFESEPGDEVTSADLAEAVGEVVSRLLQRRDTRKIGRNTFSSWEQTGHLEAVARTTKVRRRAVCTRVDDGVRAVPGPSGRACGSATFRHGLGSGTRSAEGASRGSRDRGLSALADRLPP